ncbi:putative F-box/FBD/LRR-repeat protein At4g03220 [Lolium perenne]|uniref:putative F-box/FBD/LRR-repeat protein At4g03220 n=1 Tax=Lolium perenne TaxID=4522 RepID=UPI0021F50356|nr:uncharacterized protein LOC127302228 [Lolium perenne]
MELRSDSALTLQSLPGPPPRSPPRRYPYPHGGGGEDRISALPDDVLLQVIVRFRCARAAALTSAVSRRWRGLWRHLSELSFRDIPSDAASTALRQVVCPALSRLEIEIPEEHRIMDPARVSALLHAAARLAPEDLVVDLWGHCKDRDIPIHIPSFQRATSINLRVVNLYLTLPAGGIDEFPLLERLSVAGCRFDGMAEMINRCPNLRVLEVCGCWGLDTVKIHSPTIEELVLDNNGVLGNLDVVAPVLEQFRLQATMGRDFNVLFSAPMVRYLWWWCSCGQRNVGIGEAWYLRSLDLWTEESVYVLQLNIDFSTHMPVDHDLIQQIAQLPQFSVLKIYLAAYGHVFGAPVLDLLGTYTGILRLKVVIRNLERTQVCLPGCLCDASRPYWRSQSIPLLFLEEIEIDGFEGTSHEVDFLKLLFRCATLMKRMTVRLSRKVFPSDGGYEEMRKIFEAYASVECLVYGSSGRVVDI